MAELVNESTANGPNSMHHNTPIDDDGAIIDMLNSSRLQRYFGVEIEDQIDKKSKSRKPKIKQLFNNNERKGTERFRRGRARMRQDTKYISSKKNRSKSKAKPIPMTINKKSRSRSVGSNYSMDNALDIPPPISTQPVATQTHHHQHYESDYHGKAATTVSSKKGGRLNLMSWFERLNSPSTEKSDNIGGIQQLSKSTTDPTNYKNTVVQFKPGLLAISATPDTLPVSPTDSNASTPSISTISSFPANYQQGIHRNMQQKITWRPKLEQIYKDKQLMDGLVAFMERIYCEENILFLQAVLGFKQKIDEYLMDEDDIGCIIEDDIGCVLEKGEEKQMKFQSELSEQIIRDINFHIHSIYNSYIVSNAQNQVNLSYGCFLETLSRREQLSNLGTDRKYIIFDDAVKEIERLLVSSVMGSFYESAEFAVIAQQRPNGKPIRPQPCLSPTPDNIAPINAHHDHPLKSRSLFFSFGSISNKSNKSSKSSKSSKSTRSNRSNSEKPKRSRSRNPFSRKRDSKDSTKDHKHRKVTINAKEYDLGADEEVTVNNMDEDSHLDGVDLDIEELLNNDYISDEDDDDAVLAPPYSADDKTYGSVVSAPIKLDESESTESNFEFEFEPKSKSTLKSLKLVKSLPVPSPICPPNETNTYNVHRISYPPQHHLNGPSPRSPPSLSQSRSEQIGYDYNYDNYSPTPSSSKTSSKHNLNKNPFSKSYYKNKGNGNPFAKGGYGADKIKPSLAKSQSNSNTVKAARNGLHGLAKKIGSKRGSDRKNKGGNSDKFVHKFSKKDIKRARKHHKHRRTASDVGVIANGLMIESTTQSLKKNGDESTTKKYEKSRTESPKKRSKKSKKHKKKARKKKVQRTAADDNKINKKSPNKIKKLKKIKRSRLDKRRKSNNDSDALSKLYASRDHHV